MTLNNSQSPIVEKHTGIPQDVALGRLEPQRIGGLIINGHVLPELFVTPV